VREGLPLVAEENIASVCSRPAAVIQSLGQREREPPSE
jgi:hypothetical protein